MGIKNAKDQQLAYDTAATIFDYKSDLFFLLLLVIHLIVDNRHNEERKSNKYYDDGSKVDIHIGIQRLIKNVRTGRPYLRDSCR